MAKTVKPSPIKNILTSDEEQKLVKTLRKFVNWLLEKKIIKEVPDISRAIDLPVSNDDWVMKYDEKEKEVSFNTFVRKQCSFQYYETIILHEFFHLAVQKVPNKDDAVKIRDDFGNELIKLIDIEADFFTALFYKEKRGYCLVDYLKIYYEGGKVFANKWIRIGKLERFIGTLLSISKMFINHIGKTPIETWDLYLPSISPLFTGDKIHVLVIRKEHIYFELIHANQDDFVKIRECYQEIDDLNQKGYIKKLVNFVKKALDLTIPSQIQKDIDKLK